MFSRWGKSKSSKESKKKSNVESLITSLHRKITAQRHRGNSASKSKSKSKSKSRKYSRSPSPSKQVACCHSFDEGPPAQSLPHPSIGLTKSCRVKTSLESGPPLRRTELLNLKASAVIGEAGDDPSSSYSSDSDASVYEPNTPLTLHPAARSPNMLSPCRSPNRVSRKNSFTEDMPCELFCPQNRGSSRECSPLTSPRIMSPGPGSRIQSGRGSPLHPRAVESPWPDDGKKQSYPLPLPPIQISLLPPFSTGITSPKMLRSPGRTDNPPSPTSCWKKGRLLGRGTFGHVYLGFNSGSGEMCAMKEVTLFADDAKSKECVQQLKQEISLLRHLRHPNIVQYYDSEMVDDKLYIYLEYVSGGSIHRILQEYGHLGEAAIRSYTQQILSGLAYLHAKNTLHRDIKGANILVDPNGRVRLADFGMAKHITGKSCPLSFKGSPYWMAPEVIKNSSGCNLAVDIWSLGCTVLEMATTKPPWSQYEGVAALFKVGNSKELPEIPDHLSDEGKDFVMQCLQRNPSRRPTALQLLEHPFVKNANLLERTDPIVRSNSRKIVPGLSDPYLVRNISCPVSPTGNSPQHHMQGRLSSPRSGPLSSPGGFIHPHKPNAFRVLQKTRSSVDSFSRDDDYLGNNAIRPLSPQGQLYDAHFVLASRVSQQLLGSPIR